MRRTFSSVKITLKKKSIFQKTRLTDTGEDSILFYRQKRPKVDTLFSSLFFDASERRVWLSAVSKILSSTFGRFCLYRLNSNIRHYSACIMIFVNRYYFNALFQLANKIIFADEGHGLVNENFTESKFLHKKVTDWRSPQNSRSIWQA